jgi:uncharacterized membrane protein YdjX (TVP38/TMEM64 family)
MKQDHSATGITGSPETKPLLLRMLPLLALAAALAIGWMLGIQDYFSLTYLDEQRSMLGSWVSERPVMASLMFMAIYGAAVALSFPAASVLTIFAGFLFGWLQGGIMVVAAATMGATILFLAARSGVGGLLKRLLKDSVKMPSAISWCCAWRQCFPFFW